MKEIKGIPNASGQRIGIVVARFYRDIADCLLNGALKCIQNYDGDLDNVTVVDVPGAFEVPQASKHMLESQKYDAIVTLGLVVKGETHHFNYINNSMAQQLSVMSIESDVPIVFGVLTTLNQKQAQHRSKEDNNKGWTVTETALTMLSVLKQIKHAK